MVRWISWSFMAQCMGKLPNEDPDGKPCEKAGHWITPQKFRFVVWRLEGDHEYFSNVLGLPHWAKHEMCWDCDSHVLVPGKHWNNLDGHSWVVKTLAECRTNPVSDHALFKLPGVTSKNVCHDALHVVFNHGILAHILGGMLLLLCWTEPSGVRQPVPPENRLALIWQKIQQYYKEHLSTTRLRNLKLKMCCA